MTGRVHPVPRAWGPVSAGTQTHRNIAQWIDVAQPPATTDTEEAAAALAMQLNVGSENDYSHSTETDTTRLGRARARAKRRHIAQHVHATHILAL